MTQLHCYVPDDVAEKAQRKAKEAGMSVSRYLAELVKRDTGASEAWPEGYFELFGKWEGAPLERAPQGQFEERSAFE
ncbi:hypothetical protein GPA22_20080 [Aromatoleum toluvorans]|uniref:Uncharacterized protein n=1 Tax=Aromatoleum toluvorans TaxID=92002 RepID=A0ABX1Q2T0_9RHOO|nr:hypothetical protein [Aromatoleum toluvorans]NMG46021.1 hypothetical protein [Aromatoleum toluvorans]